MTTQTTAPQHAGVPQTSGATGRLPGVGARSVSNSSVWKEMR